ncbi:hypothetical protein BGZ91_007436 [Linnemannia elongata]|nr:hypothetical protein BGZ91_007436 [Linnemannia elongata]
MERLVDLSSIEGSVAAEVIRAFMDDDVEPQTRHAQLLLVDAGGFLVKNGMESRFITYLAGHLSHVDILSIFQAVDISNVYNAGWGQLFGYLNQFNRPLPVDELISNGYGKTVLRLAREGHDITGSYQTDYGVDHVRATMKVRGEGVLDEIIGNIFPRTVEDAMWIMHHPRFRMELPEEEPAITRVTATWSDAVTDEPAGQRYGVAEKDMFFDLKDLVTTLRTTAGANPPYWMNKLTGSEFLPDFAGGNEYMDLADRLGQTFDSSAMEAVAGGQTLEYVTEADGSPVSIGKMVRLYIQRLSDPTTRNALNTELARFQRSTRAMVEGRLATMRPFNPELTPTTPGSAGGVTLDLSAQYRDVFGEAIEGHETDLRILNGHADVFAKWTKLDTAIWKAPNPELWNEVSPFACSVTVTKRSLAKRADGSCIPKITVLNRDTLSAKDKGNTARLNRQAQILRMIKFFTGNNKILRNDNGGIPNEGPFSPGDISARDVHEDAEDPDAAWGLVTDAFSSVLDNQPEVMITAESRNNTINTFAKKFLGIYGTSYRDVKGTNDPPGDTGAEGEPDADVMFDNNNYGDPQDIGSVAGSGVLDDLAETTGATGTVGIQPDIENGEEVGIDMSHMLPGTDEYAQVYRVMATVARDLIKNPNTPSGSW